VRSEPVKISFLSPLYNLCYNTVSLSIKLVASSGDGSKMKHLTVVAIDPCVTGLYL